MIANRGWHCFCALSLSTVLVEYCHAVNLDYVDEDGNVWRPVLKNKATTTIFFSKNLFLVCYSCGLSTATIEYSSACVCVCLSVCLCVCKHDNSKNNWSRDLKFEYIVAFENYLDEFDIGHCPIKVKDMAWLWNFFPFTTIQTVKSYISASAQGRKF